MDWAAYLEELTQLKANLIAVLDRLSWRKTEFYLGRAAILGGRIKLQGPRDCDAVFTVKNQQLYLSNCRTNRLKHFIYSTERYQV
jgi:hypothetical protein